MINVRALAEDRIGGYFESLIRKMGGTELECAVAYVIGTCFARSSSVFVSTEHLQARCRDRGVRPGRSYASRVSHGTIARVLELLRLQGLTWTKAHFKRWHGALGPDPALWPRARPRRHADGSFRCAARRLMLIGYATTLFAAARAPALEALSIEPDLASGPPSISRPQVTIRAAADAEVRAGTDHVPRADGARGDPDGAPEAWRAREIALRLSEKLRF